MDEAGTLAAAGSVVEVEATPGFTQPVALEVNRPFLFALSDRQTGVMIFLGQILDPTAD